MLVLALDENTRKKMEDDQNELDKLRKVKKDNEVKKKLRLSRNSVYSAK